jgi:hypothetical protein
MRPALAEESEHRSVASMQQCGLRRNQVCAAVPQREVALRQFAQMSGRSRKCAKIQFSTLGVGLWI